MGLSFNSSAQFLHTYRFFRVDTDSEAIDLMKEPNVEASVVQKAYNLEILAIDPGDVIDWEE